MSAAGKGSEPTIAEQTTRILRYVKGLHAVHLIHLGVDLGFFRLFREEGREGTTAEDLAEACGTVPRYTKIWCQTAAALELLDAEAAAGGTTRSSGIRYRLAPFMDELLANEDSKFYLGGAAAVHLQIARDYRSFPNMFRKGGTHPYQAHDRAFLLTLTKGPKPQPRFFLDTVLPKLPDLESRLDRGGRVLDLGCGGGHALVEFAKAFPNARCVGVDIQSDIVGTAKRLVARNHLQKRVTVRLTQPRFDYSSLGTFDLVTLFQVLHEINPDLKEKAIGSAAESLAHGGYLMIFDEAYPETLDKLRSEPEVFGVVSQWFEGTWGNTINTRSEIRAILAGAGLKIVDESRFARYYIATAKRP